MIKYIKTLWENTITPVNGRNLNKIEDALEYLHDVIRNVPSEENVRISNEKQRQTSETTRANNEIKRNDAFNSKVSQVDKAINASNENIEEVNNKFETITASKQQDAEIIIARDGESSLNARLERDLYIDNVPVKQKVLEIDELKEIEEMLYTTDVGYKLCSDTKNGTVKDLKIYGKSLVNIYNANSKIDEELQLKMSQNTIKLSVSGVTIVGVNKPISIGIFKNNSWVRDLNIPSIPYFVSLNDGEYIDTIVGLKSSGWTSSDFENFKKIFVINGNCTSYSIGYFEGLKSVGDGTNEIVVSSVKGDGNLFNYKDFNFNDRFLLNGNKVIASSGAGIGLRKVVKNLKPNSTVFLNGNVDGGMTFRVSSSSNLGDSDINLGYISSSKTSQTFTVPSNGEVYLGFYVDDNSVGSIWDVMLSYSSKSYEEYVTDKKKVLYLDATDNTLKKPTLREWDSIEKHSDGKYYYHRRSHLDTFRGSDSEGWVLNIDAGDYIRFVRQSVPKSSNDIGNNIISDLFPSLGDVANTEGVFSYTVDGMVVCIKKARLETPDVAGFKKWLQANNLTVVYELEQEQVFEVSPLALDAFEGETIVSINSGVINAPIDFKLTTNIANYLLDVERRVSNVEDYYFVPPPPNLPSDGSYIHPANHPASMVLFTDGQDFQNKLDDGSLRGQKGNTGTTPNITIGDVTTLNAGEDATVVKRGTTTNPIFDFGIPKGADGSGGNGSISTNVKPRVTNSPEAHEIFISQSNPAEFVLSSDDKLTVEGNIFTVGSTGGTCTATATKAGTIVIDVTTKGTRYYMIRTRINNSSNSTSWLSDAKTYTFDVDVNDTVEIYFEDAATNWVGEFRGIAKNDLMWNSGVENKKVNTSSVDSISLFKHVLSGDMQSLAMELYPEDFVK